MRTDPEGKEIPAEPASVAIVWTTSTGEAKFKSWDELAKKLNLEFKKDSSAGFQKIQVLNALSAKGWELMESQSSTQLIGQPSQFNPAKGGDRNQRWEPAVRTTSTTLNTFLLKKRVQ